MRKENLLILLLLLGGCVTKQAAVRHGERRFNEGRVEAEMKCDDKVIDLRVQAYNRLVELENRSKGIFGQLGALFKLDDQIVKEKNREKRDALLKTRDKIVNDLTNEINAQFDIMPFRSWRPPK